MQVPALNPPGTVRINDTLFADKFETSNFDWRAYLAFLTQVRKDTISYTRNLTDTLVWSGDLLCAPFVDFYHKHPAYNNYPLVGVSYEQAVEYCKWRTFMANTAMYWKEKKIENPKIDSNYNPPIRFYYRLPTSEEWEIIASAGFDSNSRVFKKWETKEKYFFHTKEITDSLAKNHKSHSDGIHITCPVNSYIANRNGIYNIIGNVAEMINEKGIAKGGSFAHLLEASQSTSFIPYTKPEKWLGFRCVAVLLK